MNYYGDDLYNNDVEENISTDVEMYGKFLTYLTDYILEFDRIIVENGENRFIVFPPNEQEPQNFIVYEARCGSSRYTETATSIEELLDEAISVVGEEKINLKLKRKYF